MAPTPSGFLHIGNVANLLLTAWRARAVDGLLALRIDDLDAPRVRDAYVDDIFAVVEWLGIPWTVGPRDADDLQKRWTMTRRTEEYRAGLTRLIEAGLPVFGCACSRAEVVAGRCVRGCDHPVTEAGEFAIRVRVPDLTVAMDGRAIDLGAEHGDAVLWRRDDRPSYHLVTVLEDHALATTEIIRGEDLLPSSALHAWLADFLPDATPISYRHHALVPGPMGVKLSKSQGTTTPLPRTEDSRDLAIDLARRLGAPLGIEP